MIALLLITCLYATGQNNYRIQSKLGIDMLETTSESDYNEKTFKITNMNIDTVLKTKWKNGVKTDSRSSDEKNLICLEGYVTKFDFNTKTGFFIIELSSTTGATIKCYIPTYTIDQISEEPSIAIEDLREMYLMQDNYESMLKNDYKNCKDGLLDFALWNDLKSGTRYKVSNKNKVRIYGFLLLDAKDVPELQPVIKFIWKQPTIEQIKKRDGI